MAVKLQVKIDLEGKDNTKKAFKAVASAAEGMASKITAISTAYMAFGQKVMQYFAAPIEAAAEAETANNKLAIAMQSAGRYTDSAYKSMLEYADAVEKASGIQQEEIQTIMKKNLLLGFNEQQILSLTEASSGLAKATEMDLASANNILIASLTGNLKALEKLVPGVAALTKEQAKAGEAVRLTQEAMRKFITGDAKTAAGAYAIINAYLEEFSKQMGQAFLSGLNLPGLLGTITALLRRMTGATGDSNALFQRLGELTGDFVVRGLQAMEKAFKVLGPMMDGAVWVLGKLDNVLELVVNPLQAIVIRVQQVATAFTGLWNIIAGGPAAVGENMQAMSKEFDTLDRMLEKNRDHLAQNFEELFGMRDPASSAVPRSDKVPSLSAQGAFRGGLPGGAGIDEGTLEAGKKARLDILDEIAKAEIAFNSQAAADFLERTQKIRDMQATAAKAGIDISAEANQRLGQLAKEYSNKIGDEYNNQNKAIAEALGRTHGVIEAEYIEQDRALQRFHDRGLISEAEYQERLADIRDQANRKALQTTGSASTDEALNQAADFVGAVGGGLNSVIGKVGQMFGPIGTIVAGIVQMFNQAPEQFMAMLDGLITRGVPELLTNVLEKNLPALIEHLPVMVAAVVGKVFDMRFWGSVLSNLWKSLINMFKNFWAVLFGGKMTDEFSKQQQATQGQKFQGFGNDDPNAGDGEFKIKDADLRNRRRAGGFEDTFEETVQSSSKSFTDYLIEAWRNIIDMLGKWFAELPGKIWNGLMTFIDRMVEFGHRIWDGLWNAVSNAWATIHSWGRRIGEGLWSFISDIWENLKSAGRQIGQGIWAQMSDLWNSLLNIGRRIGQGIWEYISDSWDNLKNAGRRIGYGIWNYISDGWENFKTLGRNIAVSFWNKLIDFDWGSLFPGGGGGGDSQWYNPSTWYHGGMVTKAHSNASLARAMAAAGALQFASGGMVPGSGFRDTVPAVMRPGEEVLTPGDPRNRRNGGGQAVSYNFTFNVAPTAKLDKEAIRQAMPMVIDSLRRDTRNGIIAIDKNGVA